GVHTMLKSFVDPEELHRSAQHVLHDSYMGTMNSDAVLVFRDAGVLHAFATSWTAADYQRRNPTADDFCTDLTTMRQWQEDIGKVKSSVVVGMISVDLHLLKQQLLPAATRTLEGMTSLLLGAFNRHCQVVGEILRADIEWLKQQPTELPSFVAFVAAARPHMPGGEKALQVDADEATTATFCELLGTDAMNKDPKEDLLESLPAHPPKLTEAPGGPSDAWIEMNKLFNEYHEGALQMQLYIEHFTPVMVGALKQTSYSLIEELKTLFVSMRAGIVVDPQTKPRVALDFFNNCKRQVSQFQNKVEEVTGYQQLFQSAPLKDLHQLLQNTMTLLAKRVTMWEGLGKWDAFLHQVAATDVLSGKMITREEVQEEIAAIDRVVRELEMCAVTSKRLDVETVTEEEASFAAAQRVRVDLWKSYMPMLEKLCHPALHPEHWRLLLVHLPDVVYDLAGPVSLAQLLTAGVLEATELVEAVWLQAVEEARLLAEVEVLEAEWMQIRLEVTERPQHGVCPFQDLEMVLSQVAAAQEQLTAMTESEYLVGVAGAYEKLEGTLLSWHEVLLETARCQQAWVFCAELFAREDIRVAMPLESARFETLHGLFGRLLFAAKEHPEKRLLRNACGEGGLLRDCREMHSKLAAIRTGCGDYLDQLRAAFPRLNLLGDSELLSLSARTGNPAECSAALLQRVLPGVQSLVVELHSDGRSLSVIALQSSSWEVVQFTSPVVAPKETGMEEWLRLVDESLRVTVRQLSKACLKGSATMWVSEWVSSFPRQCVLLADQVVWTDSVHAALYDATTGERGALRGLLEQNVARVESLSVQLRPQKGALAYNASAASPIGTQPSATSVASTNPEEVAAEEGPAEEASAPQGVEDPLAAAAAASGTGGEGSPSEALPAPQKTLSSVGTGESPGTSTWRQKMATQESFRSLVMAGVMHREVVERMVAASVMSQDDFEWQRQVRHYWEPDVDQCNVAIGYTRLKYGFEWVPLSTACVLMPPTTLHLLGAGAALQGGNIVSFTGSPGLCLGGAESAQALAVACGRLFIKVQCATLCDHRIFTRLLSGLLQCGGWGCLEECHTLVPSMVSLLSQQLLDIQQALSSKQDTFVFRRSTIRPDPGFACFLTSLERVIHPHTAEDELMGGHHVALRLDDAVRMVSRAVHVQPLDVTLIAEAGLRVVGLPGAQEAAKKLSTVLRVCHSQISRQPHYRQFIMRSLFSMLRYVRAKVERTLLSALNAEEDMDREQGVALPEDHVDIINTVLEGLRRAVMPGMQPHDCDTLSHVMSSVFGEDAVKPAFQWRDAEKEDGEQGVEGCAETTWEAGEKQAVESLANSSQQATAEDGTDMTLPECPEHQQVLAEKLMLTAASKPWLSLKEIVKKALELSTLMNSNRMVVLLGSAGSGKTSCYTVLQEALRMVPGDGLIDSVGPERIQVVYPESMTEEELVGSYKEGTLEWKDGALACLLSQPKVQETEDDLGGASEVPQMPWDQKREQWLVLDGHTTAGIGDVATKLVEPDSTILCGNGDHLECTSDTTASFTAQPLPTRLLCEVQSLAHWSPTIMGHVGILSMDQTNSLDVSRMLHHHCMMCQPKATERGFGKLWVVDNWSAMNTGLEMVLQYRRLNLRPDSTPQFDLTLGRQVLDLFLELLVDTDDQEDRLARYVKPEEDPVGLRQRMNLAYLLAATFVLGSALESKERYILEGVVRVKLGFLAVDISKEQALPTDLDPDQMTTYLQSLSLLPEDRESLFDMRIDMATNTLVPWKTTDFTATNLNLQIQKSAACPSMCTGVDRRALHIVLPTTQLLALTSLMHKLVRAGQNVLLCGGSMWNASTLMHHVMDSLPERRFSTMRTALTRSTAPGDLAQRLTQSLHRRHRQVLRPALGARTVLLVEDLHVPVLHAMSSDLPGRSPRPLEWLRQLLDRGRFLDLNLDPAQPCAVPGLSIAATASTEYCLLGAEGARLDDRFFRHFLCMRIVSPAPWDTEDPVGQTVFQLVNSVFHDIPVNAQSAVVTATVGLNTRLRQWLSMGSEREALVGIDLIDISVYTRMCIGMSKLIAGIRTESELNSQGGTSEYAQLGLLARAWRHEVERELLDRFAMMGDHEGMTEVITACIKEAFPGQNAPLQSFHGEREIFAPLGPGAPFSLINPLELRPKLVGGWLAAVANSDLRALSSQAPPKASTVAMREMGGGAVCRGVLRAANGDQRCGSGGGLLGCEMGPVGRSTQMQEDLDMTEPMQMTKQALLRLSSSKASSDAKPATPDDETDDLDMSFKWDMLSHGAVSHVTRLVRFLEFQWHMGHVLLVGDIATGRRSAVRLAARVLEMSYVELGHDLSTSEDISEGIQPSTETLRRRLLKEVHTALAPTLVPLQEPEPAGDSQRGPEDAEAGKQQRTLLVAPEAITSSDELLGVLQQILLGNGQIPGLLEAVNAAEDHLTYSKYDSVADAGLGVPLGVPGRSRAEAKARPVRAVEAEERRRSALQARVQAQVRVVLVLDEARYMQVQQGFPSLLKYCGVDCVMGPSQAELAQVFKDAMASLSLWSGGEQAADVVAARSWKNIKAPPLEHVAVASASIHSCAVQCYADYARNTRCQLRLPSKKHTEMLWLMRSMMTGQRKSLWGQVAGLKASLLKLESADNDLVECEQRLAGIQPRLERTVEITDQLVVEIAEMEKQATVIRADVMQEEERVAKVNDQIQSVHEKSSAELDQAVAQYDASMAGVMELVGEDIVELRSFNSPPKLVKIVMEAVCILHCTPTTWTDAQLLLADTHFLQEMQQFDKDLLSENTIRKLQPFVRNPNFKPSAVEQVSRAARSLCVWVLAVDQYAKLRATIKQRAVKLEQAQEKIEGTVQMLETKRGDLRNLELRIGSKQAQHGAAMEEQRHVEQERLSTQEQQQQIEVLTSRLAPQRNEWEGQLADLQAALERLVGDSLLAAASVLYLGPLTETYRHRLTREWVKCCTSTKVAVDMHFTLNRFLAMHDPFANYLPKGVLLDAHSRESVLLVTHSHQWPLMVDPDGEALALMHVLRPPGHWKMVSIAEPAVEESVKLALESGTSVLLQMDAHVVDVTKVMRMLQLASELVQHDRVASSARSEQPLLPIGVFLYTRAAKPVMPPQLAAAVTLVNFSLGTEALENRLLSRVLDQMLPRADYHLRQIAAHKEADRHILLEIQAKLVAFISKCDGPVWTDQLLVESLLSNLTSVQATRASMRQSEAQERKLRAQQDPFRRVAHVGCLFFTVLSELATTTPRFLVPFALFAEMFNRALALSIRSTAKGRSASMLTDFGMESSAPALASEEEIQELLVLVTRKLYEQMCLRLSRADTSILGLLLSARIMLTAGTLKEAEWDFIMDADLATAGREVLLRRAADKQKSFMVLREAVVQLEATYPDPRVFAGLAGSFAGGETLTKWTACLSSSNPLEMIPAPYDNRLKDFHKVVLMRVVCPPRFVTACEWLAAKYLNQWSEMPQSTRLQSALEMTSGEKRASRVIVMVSSEREDAASCIMEAAAFLPSSSGRRRERVVMHSLGQRHSTDVEAALYTAEEHGKWLVILNAEMEVEWLYQLVRVLSAPQELTTAVNMHPDFRVIICVQRHALDLLPGALLTTSVILSLEPPRSIRARLIRNFQALATEKDFFDIGDPSESERWQRHAFGLVLFHSTLNARFASFACRRPGLHPQWTQSDLLAGINALRRFFAPSVGAAQGGTRMVQDNFVDYTLLNHMLWNVAYQPRVTSSWDRRECECLLGRFVTHDILSKTYIFQQQGFHRLSNTLDLDSKSEPSEEASANSVFDTDAAPLEQTAVLPAGGSVEDWVEFITVLLPPKFELCGPLGIDMMLEAHMKVPHEAVLLALHRGSARLLGMLQLLGPPAAAKPGKEKTVASIKARVEDVLLVVGSTLTSLGLIEQSLHVLPITEPIVQIFSPIWTNELQLLKRTATRARDDLQMVKWALKSETLRTPYTESVTHCLMNGVVAKGWELTQNSNEGTIQTWMKEVQSRTVFLRERRPQVGDEENLMIDTLVPAVHRLSRYANPQAVLLAYVRLHAHENQLDIDQVHFQSTFASIKGTKSEEDTGQGRRLHLTDLQIVGARWDVHSGCLMEPAADSVLFAQLPEITLTPSHKAPPKNQEHSQDMMFDCAVYRAHVMNSDTSPEDDDWIVTSLRLPSRREPSYWVCRNTAIYSQLPEGP
ncbi:hypothetical protein CYMTET_55825, partial [Cymbomonas tetramitiformis]